MKCPRPWQALGFAIFTFVSSTALADEDQCYLHRDVSIERLLRRLSIDLRATVPEVTEYEVVKDQADVPDEVIDAYLDTDEFRMQMRRYHENLLWTNPSTNLTDDGFLLSLSTTPFPVYHVTSPGMSKLYRGGDGTHICQDKSQDELGYDQNGLPIAEPKGTDSMGPYVAEGWVKRPPYWDPSKVIKVCAFDAQETEEYTLPSNDPDAGPHSCDHVLAIGRAKSCGCGPNFNYCMVGAVQPAVLSSMREQLLRLVDDYTSGTRPYSELVTTKRAWMNGPLAHYLRYLGQRQGYSRTQNLHQPSDGALPDLAYTDADQWVEIERDEPHSGILTLPAYLLRFQTNRGRANRYRIAFEAQFFQPPSAKDKGCASDGDDLTQRCVCRGCHTTLEPLSAYFGQFVESGSTSLAHFEREFPSRKACVEGIEPASSAWCDRFYGTVPDLGDPDILSYKLKPLRYADADHPEVEPHYNAGPGGLAKADIESGLFHEVATNHMFQFLMKREPNLDPTSIDYEGDLLAEIASEFKNHDNLKLLVKKLVKLPTYRRMP